jgi:hypothetical protein
VATREEKIAFLRSQAGNQAANQPQIEAKPLSREEKIAFIRQKMGAPAGQPAEASKPQQVGTSIGQTAVESFGKGASMGYLAHLQAMAEPLTDRAFNLLPGPDVEPAPWRQINPNSPEYVVARDENLKRQAAQAEANPVTAGVGEIAGVIASTAVPGAAINKIVGGGAKGIVAANQAKKVLTTGQVLKGAAGAGVQAAAMNPGDKEGVVDPFQIDQRLENAKTGALMGGAVAGTAKSIQSVAPILKKGAEVIAFKSSGAMLKDFRQAASKGEVEKIGRFMLDNKIVQAGDSYEDVARKAAEMNKSAGAKLDKIYNNANGVIKKVNEKVSARWQELTPKEFSLWKNIGFNPVRDKKKIMAQAKKALGDETGAKSALARLETYLDDLITKYKDKILTPKQANDIKSAVDRSINYARNPLAREPDVETAFKIARKFLSKKITQHVDALAKELGDKGAAKALKQANQEYGYSKRIVQIAEDRLNRVGANNMFSLSDTMAGAGTAAAGGAAGAILGGDVESAVKGAALGLGGAAASKIARSYGAGVGARGLDIASKAASKSKTLIKGAVPTMRLLMSPDYLSNPDLYRSDEMILSGDER